MEGGGLEGGLEVGRMEGGGLEGRGLLEGVGLEVGVLEGGGLEGWGPEGGGLPLLLLLPGPEETVPHLKQKDIKISLRI